METTIPSPAETARFQFAMSKHQGDRDLAATALGISREQLDKTILANRDLRVLWARVNGDGDSGDNVSIEKAYDRERPSMTEPVDLAISPRELAVSAAFLNQESKLQSFDWEGLGEKDQRTLALMRQFEGNGVGRGVLRMMDTMQGGMAFCFMKVSRQFADVADKLEEEMAKSETETDPDKKRDENKIMLLHVRFMDLAKEMQKFNKEATSAAHTRLLIADRAKKIQKAQDKMRKPSWRRAEKVAEKVT